MGLFIPGHGKTTTRCRHRGILALWHIGTASDAGHIAAAAHEDGSPLSVTCTSLLFECVVSPGGVAGQRVCYNAAPRLSDTQSSLAAATRRSGE